MQPRIPFRNPGLFSVSLSRILVRRFKLESLLDIPSHPCYPVYGKSTFHHGGASLKNRLEEIRKQQGISQEKLADALQVSRQTIGSLENGRYNPSILLAFRIAHFFHKSIEEIFLYEED